MSRRHVSASKQLRRAALDTAARRARRLMLRQLGGQRPYVEGRQPCPIHAHCRIVFYSNNSIRHQVAAAAKTAKTGGAR